MPRYIKKQVYAENKTSYKGEKYILYHYQLDDGLEVTSLQKFKVGDRVETWFNEQYNRAVIKLYEAE